MDIIEFLDDLGLQSPKEIKFVNKIIKWAMNASKSMMVVLFTQLMMQIIMPYYQHVQEKISDTVDKGRRIAGKLKQIVKVLKRLLKVLKAILKAAIKIIKTVAQLYLNFASPVTWVVWIVTILVIVLIFFAILFGRFGTFQGEIVIDFDKMREMNQDESEYTDLLNTAALREAFYDSVSDTSFYQTFNLTDLDGGKMDFTAMITSGVASLVSGQEYTKEDYYASKKCTSSDVPSCVYANGSLTLKLSQAGLYLPQLDNRYQVTDASKNPAKYLIQAEALGTYSDSFGLTSYFRDYWNREENFSLSADFLYELNRWMYETDTYPSTEQIVYPEAFVQPVSFVHDYLRIQTDNSLDTFGNPYVYVTQRVTLEDINDPTNEFYGKYEYEGLIKTLPSDIIYDYAIVGLNAYEIAKDTVSADSVNIGNPSEYATIIKTITYEDGTTEQTEELMRLYWVVNPYYLDMHMATEITNKKDYDTAVKYIKGINNNTVSTNYYYNNYYSNGTYESTKRVVFDKQQPFIGPFVGLNYDKYTGAITFDRLLTSELIDKDVADHTDKSGSTVYYYAPDQSSTQTTAFAMLDGENRIRPVQKIIDYYRTIANLKSESYLYIPAESYFYIDGEFYYTANAFALSTNTFETSRSLFKDVRSLVTSANNLYPTKHYQLAQIADEDGNIIASSRNLINKTYLKTKTVRSSYRNSDEYWDGFEAFVNADKDKYGYVGGISNFFGATLQGQCVWMEDEDEGYKALHYCEGQERESCVRDAEKWEEKKCSIISYINQKSPARDIDAKIQNWLYGEDGEMEIPAEALYQILVEYEDYLCDTGAQGVQWEYKYYSNTNSEAEKAVDQFREVTTLKGWKIKDFTGIITYFETDKEKYKKTFDSVVSLNESRAVSTEYTPVAITSSDAYKNEHNVDKAPTNVKLPSGSVWGWRLVKNNNGSYDIKIAYGEVSYEFPDYYTSSNIKNSVINQNLQNIINKYSEEGRPVNDIYSGLVGLLFNTDYGDVIYGQINFAYKWVKNNQTNEYELQYDASALNDFYMGLFLNASDLPKLSEYEKVSGDDDQYQDIRNDEQAWNSDVIVYRPEATGKGTTATMKSCITTNKNGSINMDNCGRVTSKSDPDDYYALELKSVRDYGLGSVLSYIEGRKINFLSGLAVTETYDIDGVAAWFESYYMNVCGLSKKDAKYQAQMATMGFYPSELLTSGITVKVDGVNRPLSYFTNSTKIYESIDDSKAGNMNGGSSNGVSLGEELMPSDLAAIADGLNDLQNTGRSIFEYTKNGRKYWFTVTYSTNANDVNADTDRGFVLMMKKNPDSSSSKWVKTNINVVAPYITENSFFEFFKNLAGVVRYVFTGEEYTDKMAREEASNQFFNPVAYYLAWFDYNEGNVSLGDSVVNFITSQGLISKYDNDTAATLREIFNREHTGMPIAKDSATLSDVSNIRTKFWASSDVLAWFAETFNIGQLFKGAGTYTNETIWKEFYNSYYDSVHSIDLLDTSKSSKVYMIEEAVTFLGNFIYTYDTELLIVGDLYGNERIVSDLIFADRYYVINNYIFAVPVYTTTIEWTDEQYQSFIIEDYDPNNHAYYENIIAANNPCAAYADAGDFDEENHPVKSVFNKIITGLRDVLYVINDTLNIVDLDSAGLRTWVIRDYCTSNYYYKVNSSYSVRQNYIYRSYFKTTTVLTCKESDTSNNGKQPGVKTTCEKGGSGIIGLIGYTKTETTYKQNSRVYTDLSSDEIQGYLINGQYGNNGEYIISSTALEYGPTSLEYEWVFKYGYATKSGEVKDDSMIHIDTYNELVRVYDDLIANGHTSTAAKMFIGLQIFDNLDDIAWFNAHQNKNDLKKYGYHDVTENTSYRNIINEATQSEYERWCIRENGDDRCNDAAYGDTQAHYAVYNNGYIIIGDSVALLDRIGATFSNLWGVVSQADDIKTNLDGRYGFLMGINRLENGNLKANVKEWYQLDQYGVMDAISMPSSTDFVKINNNTFNLTQNDLVLIADAIYNVFGRDYTNTTLIAMGDKGGRAKTVELTKRKTDWTWNTTIKGTDFAKNTIPTGVENISVNGNVCNVAYYWLSNNIHAGPNMSNNLQISESILNGEGWYDANDFGYAHQIEFQYLLVNDWRLLLVGFEVAQYQNYGTPIALETRIWGSKMQISPVETASYFNEEVYSSWLNRMSINDDDTTAKEEYLLNYKVATSTYLYDYLTNFETYIPLGVMSDADLVARGADAYTSIGSNANRSFAYTAGYMSVIKQYLSTPGWQNIIKNYQTKPENASFITSIIQSVNSSTIITEDTMTQYLAGLIETTIQYAPTWTVEYHIENNTDGIGAKILRERSNYTAISDVLYHSLFAENTENPTTRKVKLELEDGTYHEFDMLYLGYGALLSYSNTTISTDYIASDVYGFGNATISISSTSDQRLDQKKSIEFVTIKFGKLLYKYGNVSSATMAYFYGEDYWNEMLRKARVDGLSTGPEWHNDDIELITSVVEKVKDTASTRAGLFRIMDYDEDYLQSIFTAEVVDYALSYISESTARIYLIRNTTSALGSSVSSIGSLSKDTQAMYEALTSDGGIQVVLPSGSGPYSDKVLYNLNFKDMDDMTRRLNLDLGVLMAVIMSSSNGNPCYGLGVCEVDNGQYIMTSMHETDVDNHKLGIFALKQGDKTYTANYSTQLLDYKDSCTVSDEYPWIKTSYSDADKMCTTHASVSFKIPKTSTIGGTSWFSLNELNLKKLVNKSESEGIENLIDYFEDENGMFVDGGRKALLYVATELARIYSSTGENALDTIFIYFNNVESLNHVKKQAADAGFGTDWYSYYIERNSSNNGNSVIKTLNYYDASMEANNTYVFEENDPAVYVEENLTGKTIVKTFFDEVYRKNITQTKTYSNCSKTSIGTCTTTATYSNTITDKDPSYCTVDSIGENLASSNQAGTISVNSVSFTTTTLRGDVRHIIGYGKVTTGECESIVSEVGNAIKNTKQNSSNFPKNEKDAVKEFCSTSKATKTTLLSLKIDMNAAAEWEEERFLGVWGITGYKLKNQQELLLSCFLQSNPTSYDTTVGEFLNEISVFKGFKYSEDKNNKYVYCSTTASIDESADYATGKITGKQYPGFYAFEMPHVEIWGSGGSFSNNDLISNYLMYYSPYLIPIDDVEQTIISQTTWLNLSLDFTIFKELLNSNRTPTFVAPSTSKKPVNQSFGIGQTYETGTCSYSYSTTSSVRGVEDRACVAANRNETVEFVYDDVNHDLGLYHCQLKTVNKVDYENEWKLSIGGFSASAFALYGDTSSFNEYTQDKVAMQNSGVELYVKDGSGSRNDVDVIITSTLATEDNFMLTATDYSIFAFFNSFDDYIDNNARSWISPFKDLVSEGKGTNNNYVKNELWDFPVLAKLSNPLGRWSNSGITIVEQFGYERDLANGGTKLNEGISIKSDWGQSIYAVMNGIVVSSGYNPIYGNYVEIQSNIDDLESDIISTVTGERYQITGFKILYGYLMSPEDGGYIPSVGSSVNQYNVIGKAGNSGRSTGNQFYMAIYVEANLLNDVDDSIKQTGWLPVDPEKYFTTEWQTLKFNVYYK